MSDSEFPMWTITNNTKDFPDKIVARKHMVGKGYHYPTKEHIISPSLEEIQQEMLSKGLTVIPRHEKDDPVIVESWM